uniref:CUE domain-containing protein n=1 Tax=Rhodosorus marinus TaxID=101924 RepID=A0A7S0G5P0_9RHOD|mmetsp:Transcript_5016/g.6998  ORF Transcript_5016/g.6998 Transcript_5016/m.6998 type:complete len:229 (+) Transcript_5016:206-892(+)
MASFGEEEINGVVAVLPEVSRELAKLTLEAFNGNVDQAVLHLVSEQENATTSGTTTAHADMTPNPPSTYVADQPPASNVVYDSGNPDADEQKEKQMRDDENFARNLQEEERRERAMFHRQHRSSGTRRPQAGTTQADEFGEALQEGFNTALTKAREFGNATASKIGALYNSYMNEERTTTAQPVEQPTHAQPAEHPEEQELGSFTESDYNTGANLRRKTAQDSRDHAE